MSLQPADWVFCGLVAVLTVMGLFRGLSGALAFVAAGAASAASAAFGWPLFAHWFAAPWARAAAVFVSALLIFGLVRLVVKKAVNGLLAQPSDSFFGLAVGFLAGILILAAWAWSGFFVEYSSLATFAAGLLHNAR